MKIFILTLTLFSLMFSAEGSKVLVVVNDAFPASLEVGLYYAQKRGVPKSNICHINYAQNAAISLENYKKEILEPVKKQAKGGISYILLTYGVPYRLEINKAIYSLDSFLCFPYDEISASLPPAKIGKTGGLSGYAGEKSPFFQRNGKFSGNGRQFFVTRLDGATKEIAKGLVDRAIYGEMNISTGYGKGYFDQQINNDSKEFNDMDALVEKAYKLCQAKGYKAELEDSGMEFGPGDCPEALWFFGWYKVNSYNDAFSWKPGAVGIHLDSSSCVNPRSGPNWVANALKRGITATMGTVSEPYLHTFAKPDIFFKNLLDGRDFAEAAHYSIPYSKWMMCVVGDPLYNPIGAQKIPDKKSAEFLKLSFEYDEEFPTTGINVLAESDKFTNIKVEYGPDLNYKENKKGRIALAKHKINIMDLKENSEYFFKVTLTDMYKNKVTKEGKFKTGSVLLPKINGLKASEGNGEIKLFWEDPGVKISGAKIYRSESGDEEYLQIGEVKSGTLEFLDRNALNYHQYDYAVRLFDAAGNLAPRGQAINASATDLTGVTGLVAEKRKASVELKWDPLQNKEAGFYLIYRKLNNGEFEKYRKVYEWKFTDADVKKGEKFRYKVRTMGKNGEEGRFSETVEVVF